MCVEHSEHMFAWLLIVLRDRCRGIRAILVVPVVPVVLPAPSSLSSRSHVDADVVVRVVQGELYNLQGPEMVITPAWF